MSDREARPAIVITGMSGGGKSVALNALEDHGYFCVDNLPGAMLPALARHVADSPERCRGLAVGIDARSGPEELNRLPELIAELPGRAELVFLTAESDVLIRRFSETRRRHPLGHERTLGQAIEKERHLLEPLAEAAAHVIDTSETNIHELRRRIRDLISLEAQGQVLNLVLESFAFKRGVPRDVDLVFDARCLPNPHWQPHLRAATGLERPVREYLQDETLVGDFMQDVDEFVRRWLPAWSEEQRSHLTVAIGCTGGQHRSVFLVDELAARWREAGLHVTTHHRELKA